MIIGKIVKESFKVLILASILSSIGGLGLQSVQNKLVMLVPLLILLPSLNGMIGNYGIVITAKFTTALYERKIKRPWWHSHFVKHLYKVIIPIALISAVYISVLSVFIAYMRGFNFDLILLLKIIGLVVLTTILLVAIIFLISIIGGLYVYHRKEDPDDMLIPITTSVADLGSMLLFSGMIRWMF
ncbi:MAG: magnesium transporter [Candidatus Woesearchaeota archaeon]|nr:magnesium transporter [Candidatus Woesearchaeota archaeon]